MGADLGTYDGRKIVRSKIKVTRAGDGLSQALAIDPQLLHWGEKVYVVLECDPGSVTHTPVKDSTSDCEIVFALVAGTGTIVDGDLVKAAVEAQTEKIIAAREAAAGLLQLTPNDETLMQQHADGEHDEGKRVGCPTCYPEAVKTDVKPPKASAVTKKSAGKTTGEKKPAAAKRTRKAATK